MDQFCEEFACTPREALRNLLELPDGFVDDVMDARVVRRAFLQFDANERSLKGLPKSPLLDLIARVERDLVLEDLEHQEPHG